MSMVTQQMLHAMEATLAAAEVELAQFEEAVIERRRNVHGLRGAVTALRGEAPAAPQPASAASPKPAKAKAKASFGNGRSKRADVKTLDPKFKTRAIEVLVAAHPEPMARYKIMAEAGIHQGAIGPVIDELRAEGKIRVAGFARKNAPVYTVMPEVYRAATEGS